MKGEPDGSSAQVTLSLATARPVSIRVKNSRRRIVRIKRRRAIGVNRISARGRPKFARELSLRADYPDCLMSLTRFDWT
jgi:hypothetical protein